jgi:hypothetical protein
MMPSGISFSDNESIENKVLRAESYFLGLVDKYNQEIREAGLAGITNNDVYTIDLDR